MVAIFVVLTVLVLIGVDALLQRRAAAVPAARPAPARGLRLPPGIFVHPGHTWVEVLRSGAARIGLDELACGAVGPIDRVHLPQPGRQVRQGDPLVTLERAGRRLVARSPLSGVLGSCNEELARHPERLADQAYGPQWLCTIEPRALGDELAHLRIAGPALAWLQQEVHRLGDWATGRVSPEYGAALQDGGLPAPGLLAHMDEATWTDFQAAFLDTTTV